VRVVRQATEVRVVGLFISIVILSGLFLLYDMMGQGKIYLQMGCVTKSIPPLQTKQLRPEKSKRKRPPKGPFFARGLD
jgi:hypothetical protein